MPWVQILKAEQVSGGPDGTQASLPKWLTRGPYFCPDFYPPDLTYAS
jgi:hypothetical protein